MIVEAKEDYYRGKPVIDRIVIQQYATEDAMVQALLAGEVDPIGEVPYTAVEPLQEAENVEVVIMDSLSLDDLVINSHVNGTQPESLTTRRCAWPWSPYHSQRCPRLSGLSHGGRTESQHPPTGEQVSQGRGDSAHRPFATGRSHRGDQNRRWANHRRCPPRARRPGRPLRNALLTWKLN